MNVKVEKQPKNQLKLTVTVEKEKVKEAYDAVLNKAVEDTEVDGFRKGKAPKEKVEQKLGASKLYGDTINELLQKYYSQALKENLIFPVSNPKVEIKEFDLEKDFEFTAEVATKPDVKLKDYKKALKKYYDEKSKLVHKDNEEKLKKGEKIEHEHAHLHPNEVIDVLTKEADVEIPDILVEEETTRMMSRLVNEIMAAGMKVDEYLKAQNITLEEIKSNYDKISEANIKAEFAMSEAIKSEKITVTDDEILTAINAVENEETRQQLSSPIQKIYVKTILEKNKLVDQLIKETEGDIKHE